MHKEIGRKVKRRAGKPRKEYRVKKTKKTSQERRTEIKKKEN